MGNFSLRRAEWAELVFHVLAHARGTAGLAASADFPAYTRFCARHIGAAEMRHLAEDAAILAALLPTHAALAEVQLLAWLFRSRERASASALLELRELPAEAVDDAGALAALRGSEPAELLRCAALLELDAFERLPEPAWEPAAVAEALGRVQPAAPELERCRIEVVRSLGLRGRVRRHHILIGIPEEALGVTNDHVAWQAAHEATVLELGDRAVGLPPGDRPGERDVEHAAVVLLAERAREHGLYLEHARWLAHFGEHAPSTQRERLSPHALSLLVR